PTSVEWSKYWPVRVYAAIVNHFMRLYDWNSAQRVDYFIANSENVRQRIKKFYRREAKVIYPPVEVNAKRKTQNAKREYYLVVSRIVGGKGLEMAIEAANRLGFPLKVAGTPSGYTALYGNLRKKAKKNIEFLGYVEDGEFSKLYAGAKAFLALAKDEDFGITPVEAMLCGTPVIAYKGGGYLETVIDPSTARSGQGETGIFFDDYSPDGLADAIKRFDVTRFNPVMIVKHAQKFSKERFKKEIVDFVNKHAGITRG
ncbi:MAG: glycosyltransferase, partial [Candidatus Blackburnbacteria bacterium]|nr:glycosyltransferase [Candidatus Blackburnbacteria bacterium]